MVGHEGSGFSLKGPIGGRHGGFIWEGEKSWEECGVNHRSESEVLEEGEDVVGQGVHREVGANRRRRARGLPVQGHNIGGRRVQRERKESGALARNSVGNDRQRRAEAGLIEEGEHASRSAAMRGLWEKRM